MFRDVGFGAAAPQTQQPGFWETLAKKTAEEAAKEGTRVATKFAEKKLGVQQKPAPKAPPPPPPAVVPASSNWQTYAKIAALVAGGVAVIWAVNRFMTREKEEMLPT